MRLEEGEAAVEEQAVSAAPGVLSLWLSGGLLPSVFSVSREATLSRVCPHVLSFPYAPGAIRCLKGEVDSRHYWK